MIKQIIYFTFSCFIIFSTNTFAEEPETDHGGSFSQLSYGNQKIAKSLFKAQDMNAENNLTLNQIARAKLKGNGWGVITKRLQEKGLITEKNLGQVLKQYKINSQHYSKKHSSDLTITNGWGSKHHPITSKHHLKHELKSKTKYSSTGKTKFGRSNRHAFKHHTNHTSGIIHGSSNKGFNNGFAKGKKSK